MQELIVKLNGGIWNLREKGLNSNKLVAIIFGKIYLAYFHKRGSYVAWKAQFKGIPCFPHGILGIFISGGAIIGENCTVFQQVTIGSNMLSDSKRNGSPVIGDNVYIGAGAKIIGSIKIGNNVRIGANCIVVDDVPDNTVVVMEKPRLIHKENMDNKFYVY